MNRFDMSLTSQLKFAISSNDNEKVAKLLNNMDIKAVNRKEDDVTALHVACNNKNQEALELLLARVGIDVNVKDSFGWTPLFTAIYHENLQAVDKLLDRSETDVNAKTRNGVTPLHAACVRNLYEIVKKLLASPGIDVNARDKLGDTPITDCARLCMKDALGAMLDDPRVNLDIKDEKGWGLEQKVGSSRSNSKEEKDTCLEMIKKERMRRENGQGQEQTGQAGNIGKYIAKIEKINKEIGMEEKRYKNNLNIRKQKMEDLAKKQKEEIIALQDNFAREDHDEQSHIASLKEYRDELAEQLEKLTNDDGNGASSHECSKLEPITRSLECPVCMELMQPPTKIWMCRFSHIICEVCKDKLKAKERKCPTCTTEPFIGRNYMVEDLARIVFNE